MPSSRWALVEDWINLVAQVPHGHVLDVGPGWGKAAVALRELLNERPVRIDAVELEKSYVDGHGLCRLYDEVYIGDVCQLTSDQLAEYDVVLMIDVLEHLTDEAAFALLARIPGRVVICTPVEWFATDAGLPESETHRSHWTAGSWDQVAQVRPFESIYQSLGGWLVRLGPLPSRDG